MHLHYPPLHGSIMKRVMLLTIWIVWLAAFAMNAVPANGFGITIGAGLAESGEPRDANLIASLIWRHRTAMPEPGFFELDAPLFSP